MIKYCPRCGEQLESGAAFCVECGESIPAEPMLECPICGEMNKPKARFCKKCGDKIVHPSDMVICPECGEVSYETADFCMHCGEEFYRDEFGEDPCTYYDRREKLQYAEPSFRSSLRKFVLGNEAAPQLPSTALVKPKKKMSGWSKLAVVCLVLIVLYAIGSNSNSDPVPELSPSAQTKYPPQQTTAAETEQNSVLDLSSLTLTESASLIASHYSDCEYTVSVGVVTFTFPYVESFLPSVDMLMMETRIYWILSQLSQRTDVSVCFIFFDAEVKGMDGTVHALYATMEDDTFRKLDFSELSSGDMPAYCDTYFVHPNLQK